MALDDAGRIVLAGYAVDLGLPNFAVASSANWPIPMATASSTPTTTARASRTEARPTATKSATPATSVPSSRTQGPRAIPTPTASAMPASQSSAAPRPTPMSTASASATTTAPRSPIARRRTAMPTISAMLATSPRAPPQLLLARLRRPSRQLCAPGARLPSSVRASVRAQEPSRSAAVPPRSPPGPTVWCAAPCPPWSPVATRSSW